MWEARRRMARLFDKAAAWRGRPHRTGKMLQEYDGLAEGLRWATPLVCDDAIDRAGSPRLEDLTGGVRVPFPVAFIEWRNRDDIELGTFAHEVDPSVVAGEPPTGTVARVIMRGMSARRREDKVLPWLVGLDIDVSEMGAVLGWDLVPHPTLDLADEQIRVGLADGLATYVLAAFMLALANAQNVELETVHPAEGLSRRWRRRTGQPLRSYSRIVLPHRISRSSSADGSSDPQPLELVKGHFKTYTAERPLFGRVVGTWWWEPHARGSVDAGQREHDYAFGPDAPGPDAAPS